MKPKQPELLHRGSLMTRMCGEVERCLGYLMDFREHGIFEPSLGRVEVTPEEARVHNQLLSQAEVMGLDQNCAVGMGGVFYAKQDHSQTIVVTWLGEEVSRDVVIRGKVLTFSRKGKTFRGRLRQTDCFAFKRIPDRSKRGVAR